MKVVVVTGSSRGIGFGLVRSFLNLGCSVVVSGTSREGVDKAVSELSESFEDDRLLGHPCDVRDLASVEELWKAAMERFGKVDIWINNAGIAHERTPIWEHPSEEYSKVLDINILGVLHGMQVAMRGMKEQGFGHLYNMEGLGSQGRMIEGMGLYGASKYALRYLSRMAFKETKDSPVKVSTLSPGMVITDMITTTMSDEPESRAQAMKIFNILGDRVETVTPYLAQKVLANDKSGARIAWLSGGKIFLRFFTSLFRKRDLFKTT